MSIRIVRLTAVTALLCGGWAWQAAAQAPAGSAPGRPIARTADGQPDLQGFWGAVVQGTYDLSDPRTGGGRLDEILSERSGKVRDRKGSRIIDPPDGQIPYLPWAAEKQREIEAHIDDPISPEHIDTQVRCLPTGVPRPIYFGQFRIIQAPGQVIILNEGYHLYRVIPLDGRPHIGSHTKLWMGDSRGRWEGNTLVVDVTNLNGKARLDMVGDFSSDRLHVVERWTVASENQIDYEATLDDPSVYARPWKVAVQLRRRIQPGYEFWEDACHEGERSAERMVIRGNAGTGGDEKR